MSEVGGGGEGGGELGHIYNSEASSTKKYGYVCYMSVAYLMIIQWIIDIQKVVKYKNGGHFVTVILTIEHDCMVHLSIWSFEVG